MDDNNNSDTALMTVLLERFKKQRYPRAISLIEKVERGELLSHFDLVFLKEVSDDIHNIQPLLDRQPECQVIANKMIKLCSEIAVKGLSNEKEK